ncbi:UDP-4-amino-4,6-dideoxy-N-acetyl-beta-L-altrosamine N-acetyltransferase [Kineothrix sp. MB12-C1]|uniref:UDP-4-amino-4, 6-dideoxy-N-acetyl-beta-L-altrosamine N-acetyltransferase n=1 Tax=Kineothrix sp. MB12-C1 TaxID=3070215 RepID=UPI0027D2914A|nr:UDP-4-amino-4,6-dideoxy-N-acetyl-beta-L-altrosamine N-acetyltransferase [Kineothrix sp. MB12-C1]WMC91642.1 UDP-4-amino-4,6-dideoxy-N-acetyl-beta-L-altrosamine N-acetyltransferase [Kineothrix sp. MB12-C1]
MQVRTIIGQHTLLRPMTYEDTELIIKWRNNEQVRKNFIYRETFTPEGHERWIKSMIETGKAVQFILCIKNSMRPIGSVYFRDIDKDKKEAEYGIFIGEDDASGKGYGTEAAHLAVEYAFGELGLKRLVLRVFADNKAAVASYSKAGFVQESVLKDVECSDGEKKDMYFMSMEGASIQLVSFVIPCYRSEQTISKVVDEITMTIDELNEEIRRYDYEIILVDDYSPDETYEVIKGLCEKNKKIKGMNLARNFGQHAALMAGFHHVKGDIVICLDDDGQTPANEMGKLLEEINKGSDVVYARYNHKRHSLFRNFGSRVNEEMARIMLGKPRDIYVSSYFAAKRFIVEEMKRYTHSYPYVIGLVLRTTKRISNVTVHHREREIGTSGYTLRKLFGLWFNGFTAFSVKPLRIATGIGCVLASMGFLYGIYTVVKKFVNPDVPMGFSSMMSAVVFLGGMIMLMLGLIGEYIGRMYISMNNSPQFVVREMVNEDE